MKKLSTTFGLTTLILIAFSGLSLISVIYFSTLTLNIAIIFGPGFLEISILVGIINLFLGKKSRKRGLNAIFLCSALLLSALLISSLILSATFQTSLLEELFPSIIAFPYTALLWITFLLTGATGSIL